MEHEGGVKGGHGRRRSARRDVKVTRIGEIGEVVREDTARKQRSGSINRCVAICGERERDRCIATASTKQDVPRGSTGKTRHLRDRTSNQARERKVAKKGTSGRPAGRENEIQVQHNLISEEGGGGDVSQGSTCRAWGERERSGQRHQ